MAEYIYRVKPGDTVLSVCLMFDMSYDKFAEMNPDFGVMGHRYAGELKPGERLVIGNSCDLFDRLRVLMKRNQG